MNLKSFYIDGKWVAPHGGTVGEVVNPANYEVTGHLAYGDETDADLAVKAARRAFESFSNTPITERIALLQRIARGIERRQEDIAQAISREIGVPIAYARSGHAAAGPAHIDLLCNELKTFAFEWMQGDTLVTRVPIGVVALITPWNVPINQMVIKFAPALAAGCTMVLKPSELAPSNAVILAEIFDEAGTPPGVFNLVHGNGAGIGSALSSHPDVDMVSFTGSTRAGISVSQSAAPTIKRVALELGGKSANILLDDVDLRNAVTKGVKACFANSGQACSAPSRMLVPHHLINEASAIAAEVAEALRVGDPREPETDLGPLANRNQWTRVQGFIETGISEGARLVSGGLGLPDDIQTGAYVKPTVFTDVSSDMTIAREEIFGPVLTIIPYETIDEAVTIANDSVYGLAGYVQSRDIDRARSVGRRLRAGRIHLNYPTLDRTAPFGGFKQSGIGREQGRYGLEEFLEYSAILGHGHDQ